MSRLRRAVAACATVMWLLLGIGVAIADLPRPGDWLAARRFRAREAARRRVEEVRGL